MNMFEILVLQTFLNDPLTREDFLLYAYDGITRIGISVSVTMTVSAHFEIPVPKNDYIALTFYEIGNTSPFAYLPEEEEIYFSQINKCLPMLKRRLVIVRDAFEEISILRSKELSRFYDLAVASLEFLEEFTKEDM